MAKKIAALTLPSGFKSDEQHQFAEGCVIPSGSGCLVRAIPVFRRLLRVLIVDDYRDAADSLSVLVKLWGHRVQVAYDAAMALELIRTSPFDVVLLDIGMPTMNGYELAQLLRGQAGYKDSLLVALTGWADEKHRLLWEGGFDHYLVKPVEPSTLEDLLMIHHDRLEKLPEVHAPTTPKYGVLVVDDEDGLRSMLEVALQQQGFAVWLAASGEEALDLYRRHGEAINMVLLDVRMPDQDGPQTLTVLRGLNPQIRCCFMSGELDSHAEELRSLGVASIFAKPFRLDKVILFLREQARCESLTV